ncbi:MAG: hypothetical protein HC910_03535 [Spirulinaceae cyanobacterium SM2_1_0]|nr:hypothetical protein [Spirulinaceae cyanobacterium SM2_1_0]
MTYLLFLLSIGLATALALVVKRLQQRKNDYAIAQEKLKEADKRLQEADREYGGFISREDTAKELDTKITVLTDRLKQLDKQAQVEEQELSAKISVLRAKLQGLDIKSRRNSALFVNRCAKKRKHYANLKKPEALQDPRWFSILRYRDRG